MTEHSAVIFVFFFLAEYASIVLICIFTSILFVGGYLNILPLNSLYLEVMPFYVEINLSLLSVIISGTISSLMLGIKACIFVFIFIWVRASFPRIRFDQLMSYCWTILLPIIIAFIILIPCVVMGLGLITTNFYLL